MLFRALNSAILASILFLIGVIAYAVLEAPPSSDELDSDIVAVRRQMATVNVDSEKYEGGALKALIELDRRVLSLTADMLEQKRIATLRRISIDYRVDQKPVLAVGPEELRAMEREVADAERKAAGAQAEADRYSGGLVQAMALMKAHTESLTASIVNLRYLAAKHRIAIEIPKIGSETQSNQPPAGTPGKIVRDKDAL
jgi:hypothetical protein